VVQSVSQVAEVLGGDVIYRVTVELGELPAGLRPGMSVEVQFAASN
jgi:hypothetical protein